MPRVQSYLSVMEYIRRLIALSLALSLLLTSGAMAVARGQSDIGSLMVICTGHSYTVMEISADGTPVEHAHLCPDCTLSLIMATAAAPVATQWDVLIGVLAATPVAQTNTYISYLSTLARGPPTLA